MSHGSMANVVHEMVGAFLKSLKKTPATRMTAALNSSKCSSLRTCHHKRVGIPGRVEDPSRTVLMTKLINIINSGSAILGRFTWSAALLPLWRQLMHRRLQKSERISYRVQVG